MSLKAGMLALASGVCVLSAQTLASELRVAIPGDMRSHIPAGSTEPASTIPLSHVYEGLVGWTEDGTVAPMLAENLPEISEDGRTYTFTLRENLKFHDGSDLTAQSVVDSWNFLLDPKAAWSCRTYFNGSGAVKITNISAHEPRKVSFELEQPATTFLVQMARSDCGSAGIMAKAVVDAGGKTDRPIGTGPYEVTEINPGRFITMKRFDDYIERQEPMSGYVGKKARLIDTIKLVVIPDPAAAVAALKADEIDVWYRIEMRYLQDLQQDNAIHLSSARLPSFYTLPLQSTRTVLENPLLRQAMNYAINREEMTGALTEGRASPSSSIIPASSQFFDISEAHGFTYDPERARQLIKEAGYDGSLITISTNKNYAIMYETGVMVQAYLQDVGLNAEVEVLDFASQLPKYFSGEYDLMTFNYAITLDSALTVDRFTGMRAADASKVWNNAEARQLVTQLVATPVSERRSLYEKLHSLYMADPGLLIWASGEVTTAYRDRVKNYGAWAGEQPRFWGVSLE
ncbi:peptide/nickel transport system substrate-binding protein [Aquamicrobium lusatiense]|uniref:Peptide/nickel transport system substrate-binding protein n=1 Tax=Aquamicrobium lusatiense TaxID=89772 RepID=A0A7W9S5Y3_9HYPH|nr:ABC transporter substrate-binding protein [Aquamicrobium lusatiense]MBB6014711.1 peptide/nickel transport system substrate-binding protein [Aquamicrobium lusatiense]